MTTFLIIMGVIFALGLAAWRIYASGKKAGGDSVGLENTQEDLENVVEENERLGNRPRTASDLAERLRKWRERASGK